MQRKQRLVNSQSPDREDKELSDLSTRRPGTTFVLNSTDSRAQRRTRGRSGDNKTKEYRKARTGLI